MSERNTKIVCPSDCTRAIDHMNGRKVGDTNIVVLPFQKQNAGSRSRSRSSGSRRRFDSRRQPDPSSHHNSTRHRRERSRSPGPSSPHLPVQYLGEPKPPSLQPLFPRELDTKQNQMAVFQFPGSTALQDAKKRHDKEMSDLYRYLDTIKNTIARPNQGTK